MTLTPATIPDLQAVLQQPGRYHLRGGGSKTALSAPLEGFTTISLASLRGLLAYEPGEFTFTALAGTPIREIESALAEHGQYLPFDPPLAAQGATLGGTVAAGLSGPGRYRYGGVRDFIIGIRYVSGDGTLVRGGGSVVKNSAGFDLPKLMVGSLGQFGALVELTFKVFPQPQARCSLRLELPGMQQAVQWLNRLGLSALDLEALDVQPEGEQAILWARLGGLAEALPGRVESLRSFLGGGELVEGEPEATFWNGERDFAWANPTDTVIKVPLTPSQILPLERALEPRVQAGSLLRRYSAGGQVIYLAAVPDTGSLDSLLAAQGLSGLVLLGAAQPVHLGLVSEGVFLDRVRQALDPAGRFAQV